MQKSGRRYCLKIRKVSAAFCCMAVLGLTVFNSDAVHAECVESCRKETLIHVSTGQTYAYCDDRYEMNIDVPELYDAGASRAVKQVNREIDTFTAELAEQFYDEMEAADNKGYGALYAAYEVLTNTEKWFSIKLSVSSVKASSDSYYVIYHIDRTKDEIVKFSDLFRTEDAYKTIKKTILKQMKRRMKENRELVYFTGKDAALWSITGDQNFYFNTDGGLVILFNQSQVAPGFMGTPEFTIEDGVSNQLLKSEYLKSTN